VGDQSGAEQHDRLRDECEQDRVPDRAPEVRVLPRVAEVVESDVFAGQPGDRVREAEVDRQHERPTDENCDEEHRRADQHRREEALPLEQVQPAASRRPGSDRDHGRVIL
jgi:hypothetical protein